MGSNKYEDLTGNVYGDIVVTGLNEQATAETAKKYPKRMLMWDCKCQKCGAHSIKPRSTLNDIVKKKSSGCKSCMGIWLVGQRFGRLKVIEFQGIKPDACNRNHKIWLCQCDCGKQVSVYQDSLLYDVTKSCGCLHHEFVEQLIQQNSTRNRDTKNEHSRLYRIWRAMRHRCNNPNDTHYAQYGQRGIQVCPEWLEWSNFKEWALTHGYQDNLSIDRIDNNDNYTPENCRWATQQEQCNNVRTNKMITYQGTTDTLVNWCRRLNLNYFRVKARLNTCGWSVEDAFTKDKYTILNPSKERTHANT